MKPTESPRGQKVPQTVENLQRIMARDAVMLQEYAAEIHTLTAKVNKLEQTVHKLIKRASHDIESKRNSNTPSP